VPDVAPPFDGEAGPASRTPVPELEVWAPPPARPEKAAPAAGQRRDGAWAGPFARLLAETLAGMRPAGQIAPWMTDRARAHMRRAAPVLRCGQRPRVLRVLVSWPDDSVAELSVIVGLGPRTKALAVRMEKLPAAPGAGRPARGKPGQPPQWRCTDIETG